MENFRLSYMVNTVGWDGRTLQALPMERIEARLDVLSAVGVSEVMFSGYHLEEPADFDMDGETRRIGDAMAARGMKGEQHHSIVPCFAPLDGPQDEVLRRMERSVDFTVNLRAETVVWHPGRCLGHYADTDGVRHAFERERDRHSLDALIDISAANLRHAGRYAAERGVLIAMENLDRFVEPMGDWETLTRLVGAADHPAVGYCLDSGHAWCAGRPPENWIPVMGAKLLATHLHDNRGIPEPLRGTAELLEPKGIDEHLPPGFGTIDWRTFIGALRRAGYARTVNFESDGWPGMDESEGLRHAIRYWRTCERLSAC